MIRIWTAADSSSITKTFGATLTKMKPDVPPHEFVPYKEGMIPNVEVDDILLVCGGKCLDELRKAGLVHKGKTLNSLRETILKIGSGRAMVTYDPGILKSEPEKSETLDWDLRLVARLHKTGSLAPMIGKYKWVPDFSETIAWIEKQYANTLAPVDVATDLECMGFFPWYEDKDIVSISFTAEPETAHVLYLGPQFPPVELTTKDDLIFNQIVWLLTSPKVKLRGANLKFDLIWMLVKWGVACTNFKFDTMLVGSLLNENRSNSLNTHAKVYTDMGGYDDAFNGKYDKGHMELIPAGNDLLTYAGGDTDACQRVADQLKEELLEDPYLARFYVTVLHPAARAFEKVELRGINVNVEKYAQLRKELTAEMLSAYTKCIELLPAKMAIKHRDKLEKQMVAEKSPMLPSLIHEYFFSPAGLNLKPKMVTEKTHEPSTAKAHLKMFADEPSAKAMLDVLTIGDSAAKMRSTFVDGFLKHLRPDGKFHTTYFLAAGEYEGYEGEESGTDTGRLSAKNPAFQTLVKKGKWAKPLRDCFEPPEGRSFLMLDYSQGELKVVACVSQEKTMIEAYIQGMDLHTKTGSGLAGVDYEVFKSWKENQDKALAQMFEDIRQKAKAGNFGLLYGMSAGGFQQYAWANYGVVMTLEEAENVRNLFFETYPGLLAYHSNQKAFVKKYEFVRSPLGRVAHLPQIRALDSQIRSKAERKAINSPIQSTLSDMMIWAIAEIEHAYGDDIATVGMIHDAMVAHVDTDKLVIRAAQAAEVMSNLPFHKVGWTPELKFTADAEGGPTLAKLEKIKFQDLSKAA